MTERDERELQAYRAACPGGAYALTRLLEEMDHRLTVECDDPNCDHKDPQCDWQVYNRLLGNALRNPKRKELKNEDQANDRSIDDVDHGSARRTRGDRHEGRAGGHG